MRLYECCCSIQREETYKTGMNLILMTPLQLLSIALRYTNLFFSFPLWHIYNKPNCYFFVGAGECNPDERDSRREHEHNRKSIPGSTIPGLISSLLFRFTILFLLRMREDFWHKWLSPSHLSLTDWCSHCSNNEDEKSFEPYSSNHRTLPTGNFVHLFPHDIKVLSRALLISTVVNVITQYGLFCDFAGQVPNKTGWSEEEDRKPDRSRVLREGQEQLSDIQLSCLEYLSVERLLQRFFFFSVYIFTNNGRHCIALHYITAKEISEFPT